MNALRPVSLFLVIASFLFLTGCPGSDEDPIGARTVGVYNGTGAWPDFAEAVHAALDSMGRSPEYFNEADAQSGLKGISLVIFGGGNPLEMAEALGFTGRENVRSLVNSGGGFLGIGGGAYLAGDTLVYNGAGSVASQPVGLYNGGATGPITALAPAGSWSMTLIDITNTSFDPALTGSIESLYRGGPMWAINSPVYDQIANFVQVNQAAGVIFDHGFGRVALLAFHPEIEEDNPRDGTTFGDDLDDPESEWFLVRTLTEWCLREF